MDEEDEKVKGKKNMERKSNIRRRIEKVKILNNEQ